MNKPKLNQPDVEQSTTIPLIDQQAIVDFKRNNVELNLHKYGEIKIEPNIITYNGKIYVAIDSSNPTIEEVKKEWEDDGYIFNYTPNEYNIIYIYNNDDAIYIWKDKTYGFEGFCGALPIKEHARLTKTFKALGWEV